MYTLTLILSWHLAGAVAELDNHPMYVDTMGGQIHLTGFKSRSACLNYKYSMPVQLNGAAQPYSITSRSCTAAKSSTAVDEEAIE
jgi:hypothetical protein